MQRMILSVSWLRGAVAGVRGATPMVAVTMWVF